MFVALFKRVHGSEMGFALFAREARLVDIEIYHLSPLFPTTRFAVSFLVQNPLQEVNIQKFELIAPIQTVFWFIFWDKRNFVLS